MEVTGRGMKKKRTKKIWMAAGLLALVILGGTFAYFSASQSMDNKFQSAEANVYLNELFDPKDQWVPGEEKQKEVRFGNDGKMATVLRARFTPVLTRQDGTADPEAAKGFLLNFSDDFDSSWTKIGDWYYYNKVLAPGQITDITLKSVTISDGIGNDEHHIATDYSQADYDVKIEGELLQSSSASEGAEFLKWGAVPTIAGDTVSWNQG